MIANPLIRKEVFGALRSRRGIILQVMFHAVMIALVWLFWPADGLQDIGGRQSRRILSTLSIAQVVMVALLAPAFTAASLTSERERNTLESLFATAMTPWEIATGKMAGAVGFLLLLVLSGIPVLAAPLMLGGVTVADVLLVAAVLLVTAVYLGLIGLVVSCYLHRSYRAIIVTFAILFVVCFVSAVPAWPLGGEITRSGQASVGQYLAYGAASINPLQAMLSLVMPRSTYVARLTGWPAYWQAFLPTALALSAGLAWLCWRKLRRPIAPPRPREKLLVIERDKVTYRTFLFVIDPRKRKRPIFDWQNPVLIKEFRTRPMLQAHWLLRGVGLCLIGSVLLMFLVTLSVQFFIGQTMDMMRTLTMAVGVLMVSLLVLIGPAMTAGAILADRESGVWDLLRTTRLSSWTIVSGKFQASVIPLLMIAMAMLPALFILLYFDAGLLPNVLWISAVVGMTVLLVATAGMFFSSLFSRTAVATAWTYGVLISLTLLSLLGLMGQDLFSQRVMAAMFVLNPVAAAMDAAGHAGMRQYAVLGSHLPLAAGAAAAMFLVAVIRVFALRRAEGGAA